MRCTKFDSPGLRRPTLIPRGFGIVELLVVLGTVGILMALLLPAVQQARESSRRMQCQSNLRQLGIALHTYEATYGLFPACSGGVLLSAPAGPSPRFYSPLAYLLPYLDQGSLYDGLNFADSTGLRVRHCASRVTTRKQRPFVV